MKILTSRTVNFLGFLICLGSLIAAGFFEYYMGLEPCMLCMLQRMLFACIGFILFIAIIHNPHRKGAIIYAIITIFLALCGMLVAGRQVWLQIQPPQTTDLCAPGLTYMLTNFSLGQTIMNILHSSDSCAKVSMQLFGLSMAGWTLIFFGLFILISLFQIIRKS